MKKFAITILVLTAAFSALAQTKTVTNQDLEKFRQQRLQAERDRKAKYAEMGTTPEEIERQNRERRAEMEQYSEQLRVERILAENQRIAAENQRIAQQNARREYGVYDDQPAFVYYYGGVPYFSYYRHNYNRESPVFSYLRNLPPSMRTAQEYALSFPNSGIFFNTPARTFRPRTRTFNPGTRPGITIRSGFGRRGF